MNSTGSLQDTVFALFDAQTREWELAARNYRGLESVRKHSFRTGGGLEISVQFNPQRIYSSSARVDKDSIGQRPCFLCIPHLPKEQIGIIYTDSYLVLINPYPIFARHLTIAHRKHTEQSIGGRLPDMLMLARELNRFTLFYNGPRCGASAPDHFHFQAGSKGLMPIEWEYGQLPSTIIRQSGKCTASTMDDYLRNCIVIQGSDITQVCDWFDRIMQILQGLFPGDGEPMINVLANWEESEWRVFIFPRRLHRPWQYFASGEENILLSPASVDFGGVLIMPQEKDFEKITPHFIQDIFGQVTIDNENFKQLVEQFSKW